MPTITTMKRMMMLFCMMLASFAVWSVVADEPSAPQTDGEAWNAGVEYYRAGDVTNALRVLRPLMLTRSHGARAAEVVAKLEYEKGDLEAAADAAQIALRAAPKDEKANRNFTRATDRLPTIREQKHIEEVMKQAQGKDPGAMLQGATYEARELMKGCAAMATNPPAKAVAMSDGLAKRAKALTDVWIPVREIIAQNVTNEEQAATILTQVENAKAKTKAAATGLEDMDENAYSALADAEHDLTRFLKMTALPPAAMDEDAKAQTNAWLGVECFNGRSWQQDALDFTRAFRAKFPAWARAYEQQAQSDTNMPPFSAEDQAKVSALATELEKLQIACVEKGGEEKVKVKGEGEEKVEVKGEGEQGKSSTPNTQPSTLDLIEKIRELLPKNKNGGGGGQGQPNANQNQQQNNDQQQQQNQDQQQQQDQQQDQEQQDEKESEAQESEEKPEDKDIEAVLKKAQERSDEHEAEKKARMRKATLPPNTRDW